MSEEEKKGAEPSPPHVSPDGKFFWDGERWVPMTLGARLPSLIRPGARGCVDLAIVLAIVLVIAYLVIHAVVYRDCHVAPPGPLDWPSSCF